MNEDNSNIILESEFYITNETTGETLGKFLNCIPELNSTIILVDSEEKRKEMLFDTMYNCWKYVYDDTELPVALRILATVIHRMGLKDEYIAYEQKREGTP